MSAPARMELRVCAADHERRQWSTGDLPRVRVDGGTQAAPWQIVEAVREQLGIDVALLRVAGSDTVEVELLEPGPDKSDTPHAFTPHAPSWQRPGWYARAMTLVDWQLGSLGFNRSGRPMQMRHWDVSAVLRIATDAYPVWFKAVPAVFAHEGAVMHWVSQVAPQHVPSVLAFGEAWLLTKEMPAEQPEPAEPVLQAMARIQMASIGRTDELLALGCPYRGLGTVPDAIAELSTRTDLLSMAEILSLSSRHSDLKAVVDSVADLGVPDTLVHGDIQSENARWTGETWLIIDWTDACVAHPFVELSRPLMDANARARVLAKECFAGAWSDVLSEPAIKGALRAAPVIGAAHQLETYRLMVDSIGAHPELVRLLHLWVSRLVDALKSVYL
ncbi:phosphotransferase [Streptomyces sp. HSG2]|uniref:phosphotransferase n=1 Tax=Streptomyces sp. HSG2 TaxID=2797167 RepID=UPI001904BF8F|nr:phosphotransferase [Streptomyces sp. HSG2]